MELSLDQWLERIGDNPVPVLNRTIEQLRHLCKKENAAVTELASTVQQDPGLVVHLLHIMNNRSSSSMSTEITSVQQALMMMGTDQLSRLPSELPAMEKTLKAPALPRLLRTFARAYHAAQQATSWARQRRDMIPDEIFAAAQLHFLGEMHIAMHAPQLLDRIDTMRNEKNVASEEAQYIVLGFTLDQLTARLARLWKLPQLLLEALHPENAKYPRAYGVMLAVQLARGADVSWQSDKTRKIQHQAAEWLDIDPDEIVAQSHQLAAEVARESAIYQTVPAAASLVQIQQQPEKFERQSELEIQQSDAAICLVPQINVLKSLLAGLKRNELPADNAYQVVSYILKGLHDGIGLNRVLFACYDHDHKCLLAEKIIGADTDPAFSRFEIPLKVPSLFSQLMEKNQAVLINDTNRTKLWSLVPVEFQKLIGTNSFVAMSVVFDNKPVGLFYADRHHSSCQLDQRSYQYFKAVCNYAGQTLQRLPRLDFTSND